MADRDDPAAENTDDSGQGPTDLGVDRYDFGVLFVHGIGQQAQGQTLTAWADPVIRWLETWLRPTSVRVGATELGPLPEDPAAPAHLELEIDFPEPERPGPDRWLLAEAWWAQAFGLPQFRELAVWGFLMLPWAVMTHFASRLQRTWSRGRSQVGAPPTGWRPKLREAMARVPQVAWQSLVLLMAVVLFPVLAIGVLIVVVLGAVPVPWVRQVAVAVQRLLSASVGDSFVLLSSPAREHAIVTRVERDLRWLTGRCQRIAVIGHSQGAAIAHRTLRRLRHDQHKLAQLVTFGSGQTKLADLEALRDKAKQDPSAAWEVWLAPAGLLVVATAVVLAIDQLGAVWGDRVDALGLRDRGGVAKAEKEPGCGGPRCRGGAGLARPVCLA
jgi:hypothetical protein